MTVGMGSWQDGRWIGGGWPHSSPPRPVAVVSHAGLARRIARGYFLPGHDRQDVEQEALIGLWLATLDYEPGHGVSFESFARVVINRRLMTVVTATRREKHRALTDSVREAVNPDGQREAIMDTLPGPGCPSEAIHARDEFRLLVEAIRDDLTVAERDALIRVAFDGETVHRGVKDKRVDNAVQRARRKLRARLEAAA